jgi:hypothetical protein
MELQEFLLQTQAEVRAEIGERMGASGEAYPYPESVFAEIVMQHMSEIGMTFEPEVCHYSAKVGNANLRLSGFAVSDDADQLDLFVSLYDGVDRRVPNNAFGSSLSVQREPCRRRWTKQTMRMRWR